VNPEPVNAYEFIGKGRDSLPSEPNLLTILLPFDIDHPIVTNNPIAAVSRAVPARLPYPGDGEGEADGAQVAWPPADGTADGVKERDYAGS